ncbi:SAM-dependent methyltransferase [uncultured Sphingomonas sp.]|uniref:SAM-dependent methyltransferase n=1 Tax=uncultured Sphingomonas sp. TaxID=158754 RepID=UPI0035CC9706
MKAGRLNLAAAALTLGAASGVALGARCLSATQARCSVSTLFGSAPRLDVPYAATRPELVERMLDMAGVRAGDRVLDLGTGDGRILLAAAKRGARGLGVDIDPVLVADARAAATEAGVADRVRFEVRDLFATPLDGYDVVTMFLLPEVNMRLRPRLLAELAPGARIVSHVFEMGDWRPDRTERVGGARAHLWIVPARVAGRWRLRDAGGWAELRLTQRYQDFGGVLIRGGRAWPLSDTKLDGARIRLSAGGPPYVGAVTGNRAAGPGWAADRIAQ